LYYFVFKCYASEWDLKGVLTQLALMAQLNSNALRIPFVVQSLQSIAQIFVPHCSVGMCAILGACALLWISTGDDEFRKNLLNILSVSYITF